MKGYLSFVLVFASVILILGFVQADLSAGTVDLSRAISAERAYQAQMNVKEVLLEAAAQGGLRGYGAYADGRSELACVQYCPDFGECLHPKTPPCDMVKCADKCFRISDAQSEAEKGAMLKMREVSAAEFDSGADIVIWCGPKPPDAAQTNLAERMRSVRTALACDGCSQLPAPACDYMLTATVLRGIAPDSFWLESIQMAPRSGTGVIGASFYYPAQDLATVSYIPAGVEVEYG
ncbi:MAG TPA: hypothetical protein EYP90_14745 [Chromatiaceae bacterium]|nr:hypothetical protein [Chromatiaceae bacterium]